MFLLNTSRSLYTDRSLKFITWPLHQEQQENICISCKVRSQNRARLWPVRSILTQRNYSNTDIISALIVFRILSKTMEVIKKNGAVAVSTSLHRHKTDGFLHISEF